MMHIWLRDEARDTEQRTPLTPKDAAALIDTGARITVERSDKRVFPDADYGEAGCELAEPGGWTTAPRQALILGVKEMPSEPQALHGRFAHFAHLYKDQRGWEAELRRFAPDAALFDLEYLTDAAGARVAAFGYWAGWLGAALGVWGWLAATRGDGLSAPFAGVAAQTSRDGFLKPIRALVAEGAKPRVLIVGAAGRSGGGAAALCAACGIDATLWDIAETRDLHRDALLSHDILVSCVLMRGPGLMLARREDLRGGNLAMISDVACDPLSDFNPLPLYDAPTSWREPFLAVAERADGAPVRLTAIDNLPSLLPREASEDFSAQLCPVLAQYPDGVPWRNSLAAFDRARSRLV